MITTRRRVLAGGPVVLCLAAAASGCAPKLASLPTGPGAPVADFAAPYAQATEACRGVRTLVAVLSLSGRVGGTRLRGNVEAGLAEPGLARLDAPGPFGSRPIFILVARGDSATLVLPRDRRVLRDAPPVAVVEALAGVPLTPDQLRGVLAGCGFASAPPDHARSFGRDLMAVDTPDVVHWLRRSGGVWRLVASAIGPLEVRYSEFASGRPSVVRLRREGNAGAELPTDIAIQLSQVDLNVPLPPETFDVEVPPDAIPMTLDELRRSGPLGDAR